MHKTLSELLDYAEECLSKGSMLTGDGSDAEPSNPVLTAYYQKQCVAASALARAVAAAAIVQFDEGVVPDA